MSVLSLFFANSLKNLQGIFAAHLHLFKELCPQSHSLSLFVFTFLLPDLRDCKGITFFLTFFIITDFFLHVFYYSLCISEKNFISDIKIYPFLLYIDHFLTEINDGLDDFWKLSLISKLKNEGKLKKI